MGPQHGIVGDEFGVDLPQTQIDDQALNEEKKAARYSKSAEYKRLKLHMETIIEQQQKNLPDGTPVSLMSAEERGKRWEVANEVIAILKGVIDFYEEAADIVKNAEKGK